MKSYHKERVPPSLCPCCGKLLDMATHHKLGDYYPAPGDFSICIKCASVLVFDDDFKLRQVTSLELSTLPKKVAVDLTRAVRVAKQVILMGGA